MPVPEETRQAKRRLRLQLLARRTERSTAEREQAADALCARVYAIAEVAAATRLTCYSSLPEEPGTAPLLAALTNGGCEVLLPVLRPDYDLDWAVYAPDALQGGRLGIAEPNGVRLGPDAVSGVSAVICPALAVDRLGHRLGRGAGCYDRVLSRLPGQVLRIALLFDDEVLDAVPTDSHDQRVQLIVTPQRTLNASSRGASG